MREHEKVEADDVVVSDVSETIKMLRCRDEKSLRCRDDRSWCMICRHT